MFFQFYFRLSFEVFCYKVLSISLGLLYLKTYKDYQTCKPVQI
uniref:Uncharacterized protein n=1 Tax=Arundo donax TaxID=35708 RepID=A0A0A9A4H4_ARUDO